MARLLKSGTRVLLLDQPTNDRDAETLDTLDDGLAGRAGTISRDRWFLDRVATHTGPGFADVVEAYLRPPAAGLDPYQGGVA